MTSPRYDKKKKNSTLICLLSISNIYINIPTQRSQTYGFAKADLNFFDRYIFEIIFQ